MAFGTIRIGRGKRGPLRRGKLALLRTTLSELHKVMTLKRNCIDEINILLILVKSIGACDQLFFCITTRIILRQFLLFGPSIGQCKVINIFVYRMEFYKTRWSCLWNSDQNCTQNSARGGGGPMGWESV